MRKVIIAFLILAQLLIWGGCSSQKGNTTSNRSNEIYLSEAIANMKDEIYLSEWIDSVSYVPMETTNSVFIRNLGFRLTPEYIFSYNRCFDWAGNYIGSIGKLGGGICEEPGQFITTAIYIDSCFYTIASKFIEYDINGVCTGKQKSMYTLNKEQCIGRFSRLGATSRTGKNLMCYNFPDTMFFFNTDFEVVGSYPIMKWETDQYVQIGEKHDKSITFYKDTAVFYNYFTDTVYHATENTLIPKWVIRLDDTDKISTEYLYEYSNLLNESFQLWKQGKFEEAQICKLTDNKIYVSSIHETERFLFILARKTLYSWEVRKLLPPEPPFFICIDKSNGETVAAKKVIDDLGGMDTFLPNVGICNDKMVNVIWPYELEEFIKAKQEKGQKIDKRLLDLASRIDSEDNPILIYAHLKE